MGADEKKKGPPNPSTAAQALPTSCPVCGKKAKKMHFCEEHFLWFKEGLVNKRGERPSDFDKKYQAYMRRQAKAA